MLLLFGLVQIQERCFGSYGYTDNLIRRTHPRRLGIPAWILAIAGLLVLLLAVSAVIHPVFVPLCCVLLPIFLFGELEDSTRWVPLYPTDHLLPRSAPQRIALFQRPPPFFS